MAPEKASGGRKKKKKKGKEQAEPTPHDPDWSRAIEKGRWARTPAALPDADQWPTWGALRERILMCCREISVTHTDACTDAFIAEIVKLSPPELHTLELRGNRQVTTVHLCPPSNCPSLQNLDLSSCPSLRDVYIQSQSLQELRLDGCPQLSTAIVHTPALTHFTCTNCCKLEKLLLWSDVLEMVDAAGCGMLRQCKLHCPKLQRESSTLPELRDENAHKKMERLEPIAELLREEHEHAVAQEAISRQKRREINCAWTVLPRIPTKA